MEDTIELLDGSFCRPRTLSDAMDIVEEYVSTDFRQFLEDFFLDGTETGPEEIDDHYAEVLRNLDDILCQMEIYLEKKRIKKEDLVCTLNRLRATIRHEIGEKQ